MVKTNILFAIVLEIAGIIWILKWDAINQERKMSAVLSITMNSGQIIINMNNNRIDGNAKILESAKIG